MKEPEFEWDASKPARNEADHGVTFEMARDVFKDPFAIEWLDDVKTMVKSAMPSSAW